MTWIPGSQRFPFYPTSDRLPHALSRQIVIGFRSAGRDLFYQDPGDILTPQIRIRGQLPKGPQIPPAMRQGLIDLGV